jgi:hypothetical protein
MLIQLGSRFMLYELRHTFPTRYCHTRESHTAAAMKKYIGSFEQPVEVAEMVN